MVILAMTIERMSIVWDENGPRDALLSGFGSLAVAATGFLVMTNEWMKYLAFVFPELLLLVLAFTLLAGRYTGYRVSELWRFRAAAKAIVEYRVKPHPVFDAISYRGVPDIRIIVFRGVPVASMMRLPTRQSDGKANLHQGAIGAGIQLANQMGLLGRLEKVKELDEIPASAAERVALGKRLFGES